MDTSIEENLCGRAECFF